MTDWGHFFSWGIILQILAVVHFVKRRPESYWLWIILIGGPIGAGAYLLVEVLPDTRLLPSVFHGFGRRSRIQALETQIIDNPSAGNYEELGDLNLEEKKYDKARDAFTQAIDAYGSRKASGSANDMLHVFYGRGKSLLALGDYPSAIPDLERVACADVKFDYYRASGLLADAYARTGDFARAERWFAARDAVFHHPRNVVQLRMVSERAGQKRRSQRVAGEIAGQETDSPRLHAARGTPVVPQRQSAAQGNGAKVVEPFRSTHEWHRSGR